MKKGEIVKLGEHRLMCGDARSERDVKKLVGSDKIKSILTDPPYGVSYVENKDWLGMRGQESERFINHKKIESDDLVGNDYVKFTEEWIKTSIPFLSKYNSFYIFNSDSMVCELKKGIGNMGFYYSQMIIWVKNTTVLGRKDYNPQHELIVYGWYKRHKFEGSKKKSVILHPKPHRSVLHPTMKPIGLLRKLMLNSTKVNDIVYDPLGGSGSTLMACEQTKRKCLMIEIDPGYCDVIKERYRKYKEQEKLKS